METRGLMRMIAAAASGYIQPASEIPKANLNIIAKKRRLPRDAFGILPTLQVLV